MKKHHYQCRTCYHTFDTGKIIIDGEGHKNERCPFCESWNYYLTNLSVTLTANGIYLVEYNSPALGITLFGSADSTEAYRVFYRMENLKWDVFQKVLAGQPDHEARTYLNDEPCIMNGFKSLAMECEEAFIL